MCLASLAQGHSSVSNTMCLSVSGSCIALSRNFTSLVSATRALMEGDFLRPTPKPELHVGVHYLTIEYCLLAKSTTTYSEIFTIDELSKIRSRTAERDKFTALTATDYTKPISSPIKHHGPSPTLHNLPCPRHSLWQTGRQHLRQAQARFPIASHHVSLDGHDKQRRPRACMELINRHERAGGSSQEPAGRRRANDLEPDV